jgi:alkylhydroperoxidase family enzyme
MARIGFGNDDANSEVKALAEQIRRERGGLGELYRTLLNSPPVARGWLNLLTAIRQQCELPDRYREIVIIRIAVLNGADYEKQSHIPHARKAGMSDAQIEALSDWRNAQAQFDEGDRAVLAYTDAMTKDVQVSDAVFAEVRKRFDDRQLTELTATIAAYNLVSRFLIALQVGH